ncbi:hypothetical protein TruAng_008779 [Truncatella angustata]|nr:hypothetical protein TruAng_008779 [Truncatella angustata]
MQFSYLATILLLELTTASPMPEPVPEPEPHFPSVPVTFSAAANTGYTLYVVANNQFVETKNDLSITSISMEGRASFTCTAYGIDGSVTKLVANQVGFEQTI